MLTVIAQDFIDPEHLEKVRPLYDELVRKTRQEPLCIAYDLHVEQKDPGHFVFIERWPDKAALDTHCQTEHFTTLVPQIDSYRRAPGIVSLLDDFTAIPHR